MPIAIGPFAASALAWWRTPFALFWLVPTLAAIVTSVTRTAILMVSARFAFGRCGRGRNSFAGGRSGLRAILRGDLRARPAIGPWPPLAFAARRTRPALLGRTARAPHLDHVRLGGLLFRFYFGSRFGRRL